MARKVDPKKAEEKKAKTEELVKALKARADVFRESDETFLAFLKTSARFHHYSLSNQYLIMMQAPEASAVNSFKRWQSIGRQVRKGEKAIYIMAPRPFKKEQPDGEEKEYVTFRAVPVFAYEQTDPIEGFDGEVWTPYRFPTLTEETGADYVEAVFEMLAGDGVEVERFTDDREYRGRFYIPVVPGEVRMDLDVSMPMLQQLNTLVHEVAHYEHWRMAPQTLQTFGRATVEFIAEASSYAVLSHLGFDSSIACNATR